MNIAIDGLWAIGWHPKGAVGIQTLKDFCARNRELYLAGEDGWALLGTAETFEAAQAVRLEWRWAHKVQKAQMAQHQEGEGGDAKA